MFEPFNLASCKSCHVCVVRAIVVVFVLQVMLAVLDVGGVRVITSVLAQSAALKFYET